MSRSLSLFLWTAFAMSAVSFALVYVAGDDSGLSARHRSVFLWSGFASLCIWLFALYLTGLPAP